MYKIIRKKVAASVNSVDAPEQFEWGKWLRAPDSESLSISKISSSLSGFKTNLSFSLPETGSFNFQTKKVKLFKSKKLSSFPKEKTIKVFYKLGKSATRKIKIFDANTGRIIFSSSFSENPDNPDFIKEIKEPFSFNNFNSVREIKEAFSFNYLNFLREAEDSFALLNTKTTSSSVSFQTQKARLREISLGDSTSKTIEIKTQFKKTEPKSYFQKAAYKLLDPTPNEILFSLESKATNNVYQPAFVFLSEIPYINNFEIPNVNQLIEELDRDESSKKINIVPIEFLKEIPSVNQVKISESEKPKVSAFSSIINNLVKTLTYSGSIFFENNTSTYTFLFKTERTNILEESFDIFGDYTCENWEIPLAVENNVLNPETESNDIKDVSYEDTFKEEVDKVINDDSFGKVISKILKPEIIPPEAVSINDEYLYDFQKEGAEFLAGNKNVLLFDELGLGKTYQVISALKSLFSIGTIDKVLIICNISDIGDSNLEAGWAGKLNELAKEFSLEVIRQEKEENKKIWKENKNIFIIDYEGFFKQINENSDSKIFDGFDCFIFDEAQNLIPNQKLFKEFWELKSSKSAYTWFLSDQLNFNKRIQKELNFLKDDPIIELGRTKKEIYRELPDVVRQDVWHELDDEQKIEYENILSIGRERITKLLQNGNPFIIQSNVFTLLHQLKQIYNFASQKNSSSKSEHLLKQIENVIENDKKILVFSQYDKMGIQKIEDVLSTNKIKYILLHSGMSLSELEAAKKKFESNKKIHVLLNGIKFSRSGISLPEVQYVVHFDQWWNPATVWKGEASIAHPQDGNINVYNYFTKNSVEEKIKKLLQRKGLLRKEIIEFLSVESINEMVSLEEWLKVLDIGNTQGNDDQDNSNEKVKKEDFINDNRLNELSIDELGKKTEILFSRLGYKNIFLNKGNFEGEINIIGTMLENNSKIKMVAKCLFSSEIDLETITEYIEALQHDKNLGKNFIIHFNGLEEKLPYHLKKKIILINKDLFTNYLIDFRLI